MRPACLTLVLLALPSLALAQPAAEPPVAPTETPPAAAPVAPTPPPAPDGGVDLEAVLHGEGVGLTADEAAEAATRTAPQVERAQAALRQAQAGADRALYGFIPQLALSFRYTRLSEIQNATFSTGPSIDPATIPALTGGVDDPDARFLWDTLLTAQAESANFTFPILLNQFALRASLSYPVSNALLQILPAYEGAQTNAEAAELQIAVQRRDIALQARESFYNYARARASLAVAESSLRQAESRHEQVQAFVQAGTSAAVDELRLRAQVAAARVAVARAQSGVQLSATALRTIMHTPGRAPIAVGEDLLAGLPALESQDDETLFRAAVSRRDDVRALERLIEATGHQVDAAEGSRYPSLALQANLDYQNPNNRVFPQTEEFRESWDVSAVLSWSPHDLLNGERQADEARAQQDQVRQDLRTLEDAIRLQVTEALTTYQSSVLALEAAQLGVEAAQESYRVQMERYAAGAATTSDVIDSSAEQVRAQLDLVNAAIDARVARARLDRAIGAIE